MAMTYETGARKLERPELDVINYSDVHHHDPKKIIAFSAPRAAAPHPSAAARHRRMERRAAMQYKLLVAYPRYLCAAMLVLFVYLRLATFSEVPAGNLNLLWMGAYALAGSSFLFSRLLSGSRTARS